MNKSILQVSLAIAVIFTACTSKKEEKSEEGRYAVTSPLLMDTSYTKDYVAQIQSIQNIEIKAMVKGYLEKINVDEGQHVTAGEVLFNIRPIEFQAELLKAKAEAKAAELELQNAKTLADKNIVSQTELALAQAKLDQQKAEVALAELNLSYTEVKAPFDGIIDRTKFKVGSLIDEGTLLTTLSNNKEVYAYFNVSESEYLDYKTQSEDDNKNIATLVLANGQEHKYKGRIETIESEFDNTTGNIAFRAKFPNPDFLLKHGETGKVRLTIPIKNAMIIPQKATYEIQDKIYVYVIDPNNVVKSKNITVKQRLNNLYVIEPDISEKDRILLEGIQTVKEDDKIEAEFIPAKKVMESLQLIKQQ
jgi:membrane fusion protein (multidrug efflux system)